MHVVLSNTLLRADLGWWPRGSTVRVPWEGFTVAYRAGQDLNPRLQHLSCGRYHFVLVVRPRARARWAKCDEDKPRIAKGVSVLSVVISPVP